MAIRKNILKLVGTAFFVAGFYLLIESQWVYAALCFLIGFWYFVQSVRQPGNGKRYNRYGSDNDRIDEDSADHSAGDSYDSGDSGGGDD
jgi:hypothetical protein